MTMQFRDTLTPRELEDMNFQREMTGKAQIHAENIKKLDIEASKIEARITAWFKIPLTIIKLPLYLLFVIPLTVYAVRGKEVPPQYWTFLK